MGITKRAGRKKEADPEAWSSVAQGSGAQGRNKKKQAGVSDLTLISKITNEAINDNLRLRFENRQIYTYIGDVLVSVNPFQDLGIYTDEVKSQYVGKVRLDNPPHVFAVAESAYYNMQSYSGNQCVIISGESGAGKTEAAKRFMEFIAQRSGASEDSDAIKQKILATNPLLESFGNAKTLRNNNSSRFGKYLDLQFTEVVARTEVKVRKLEPVGAHITNYLLEKSRVVGQTRNERNFHIFYQFTKAAPTEYRDAFALQGPESYNYLRLSNCLDVPGINDAADLKDTLNAMDIINVNKKEKDNIFKMLATILWIGNISFAEDDSGNAYIAETRTSDHVAGLLNVKGQHVSKALTLRIVETSRGGRRGSVYEVPLNIAQATAVRDALAKAIYFNLFDWIVAKLNVSLQARSSVDNTIGILDIYGFEIFERNSFEQLCINYVNEKLQQIFIQLTLRSEQEEYAREQIEWTPIKYFDNKVVCQLIEDKRPPGIFAALNDACATAHADPGAADGTFVQRLNILSSNPNFQPRQGQFVIKHYAGDVNYAVEGMTDKNKDQLLKDILNLMAESSNPFVKALFPQEVNQDDKRRPPTAGDKIRSSANELVVTLTQAKPSYIRTIKPNENKSPTEYNNPNVLHQVKYLGLQENVRIRRAGYAYRETYERFFDRFKELSRNITYGKTIRPDWIEHFGEDRKIASRTILRDCSVSKTEFQMGTSMVFVRSPETIDRLEKMRDDFETRMARKIARVVYNFMLYRVEATTRLQRFYRRTHGGDDSQKLRDYGHEVLQNRKERRRFSLLGYRRFLGDYLLVQSGQGLGGSLRRVINPSSHESVSYSSECSLLVTKFGRSSKPEKRFLVMSTKAVYLIGTTEINKQPTLQVERSIPLGAIKFVSTSSLKDDWFAIGVGSPKEPDPLINTIFKTELITRLKTAMPGGGLDVRISESIEFNKKPGKLTYVKAIKDPSVPRDDFYKSGTIHVGAGEPASSRSKRTPKGKSGRARPITQGRLIPKPKDKDGPQKTSRPTVPIQSRPILSRPIPKQSAAPSRHQTQPNGVDSQAVKQPVAAINGYGQKEKRLVPSPAAVATPPPAPPAPPQSKPLYKAIYDFRPSGAAGEIEGGVDAGETLEALSEQVINGGWLQVRKMNGTTGFAPAAYLEKQEYTPPPPPPPPPVAVTRPTPPPPPSASHNGASGANGSMHNPIVKAKPTPPAPPKRPGAGGRKPPPPPTPRDSAASLSTSNGSGRSTPDSSVDGSSKAPSLAMGLAEQLKRRQKATQGKDEGDDDW